MDNKVFIFSKIEIDENRSQIMFHYAYEEGKQRIVEFVETLILPVGIDISHVPQALLEGLHMVFGVSYYKLYCPKKIEIQNFSLSRDQAQFWDIVYTKGLGEFFFRNDLDFRDHIHFPYDDNIAVPKASQEPMEEKALVTIGGGKDSIVSLELVKKAGIESDLFVLNKHHIMQDVAEVAHKQLFSIERKIDPKLLKYNALPDTFNGHVPISAIYAFVSLLYAYSEKYSYVVFANERSSNYGNVEYLGETISHQWSKSREFEDLFRDYTGKYISSTIHYFSIVRPLFEIGIAKIFIKYPQYFSVFSSSNHNFKINNHNAQKWDRNSAKTVFTYCLLAAFLPKNTIIDIFGQNLFDDQELLSIFRELLGLGTIKPFDCVGTPDEVKVALYQAFQSNEYSDSSIMKMFEDDVLPVLNSSIENMRKEVFSFGNADNIPEIFLSVLKEAYAD